MYAGRSICEQQDVTEALPTEKRTSTTLKVSPPISLVTILFLVCIFIKLKAYCINKIGRKFGFRELILRLNFSFFFFFYCKCRSSTGKKQSVNLKLDQLVDCWNNNNNELFSQTSNLVFTTISLFYCKTWEISLKQWSVTKWLVTVLVKLKWHREWKKSPPWKLNFMK